jgi:glutamate-1-semialdehyde 2,1-aminomutase
MEPRFTFFEANSTNGSGKPSVTLTQLRRLLDDAIKDYERNHPRSLSIHKDALRFLPGGNTRSVLHTDPFPICMDRGEGNRLVDVDGREYVSALDFQLPMPSALASY